MTETIQTIQSAGVETSGSATVAFQTEPLGVELRNGRIYLSNALYTTHFLDSLGVALTVHGGQCWLLPLLSGAGGLQIKIRNACGDRVIESQEFFRSIGKEDKSEAQWLTLEFDSQRGGFRLGGVEVGPL